MNTYDEEEFNSYSTTPSLTVMSFYTLDSRDVGMRERNGFRLFNFDRYISYYKSSLKSVIRYVRFDLTVHVFEGYICFHSRS